MRIRVKRRKIMKIFMSGMLPLSLRVLLILLLTAFMSACGDSDGDDGNGAAQCDVVANPGWSNNLKVINHLATGLEWYLEEYAFAADLKPAECTIFGLNEGSHTVELTQCNIGDEGCTSTFGPTKAVDFSVIGGQTYTIDVKSGFF